MLKKTKAFALFIILMIAGVAVPALAATFTVNSTLDAVDATPGNGICATAGGACSLRAAVQEANALAGADSIDISAGNFFISIDGAAENLSATGDIDINESVAIKGAGTSSTFLNAAYLDRMFDIVNATAVVTISDLSITSGKIVTEQGGGIRSVSSAMLTLTNLKISHNESGGIGGGGVFHSGPVSITDSDIFSNQSTQGGGLLINGPGPMTITGSEISGNRSSISPVGGVYIVATSGDVTLTNTDITKNTSSTASIGGGALVSAGSIFLSGVNANDNTASTQFGGLVVQNTATGNITISNSNINNNTATSSYSGGLSVISPLGNVNISNTNVKNNSAIDSYGGIQILASGSSSQIVIDGSTFSGNTSTILAGGIHALATSNVQLTNSIISDNTTGATAGGGYLGSGSGNITIDKTKVSGNISNNSIGGLHIEFGGTSTLLIDQSSFTDNVGSAFIGGIAVGNSGTGNSIIRRSLFANNQSKNVGTLLFGSSGLIENNTFSSNITSAVGNVQTSGANIALNNNTFADNLASSPAQVASLYVGGGTTTLSGNIFDSNGLAIQCVSNGGVMLSAGNNISDDASCNANLGLGDLVSIDSQLQPLADNGGATLTRAIYAGSPALDKFSGVACPATDQRDAPRPVDGDGNGTVLCDAGAYENADLCPNDPNKQMPGTCGCGNADEDSNGNTVIDCLSGADLKRQATDLQVLVGKLKAASTKKAVKKQSSKMVAVKIALNSMVVFATNNAGNISVNGSTPLASLISSTNSKVKKATKVQSANYSKIKKTAVKALKKIISEVVG